MAFGFINLIVEDFMSTNILTKITLEIKEKHEKLRAQIKELDVSPSLKNILEKALDIVYYGPKKIVAVGKKFIELFLWFNKTFPQTSKFIAFWIVAFVFLSNIPFIGPVFAFFLKIVFYIGIIHFGLKDLRKIIFKPIGE